jgi:signal transduction histidine kinase
VGALRRIGLASLLLVPLVHRDQTLGLLATVWRTAHPVSGREVQLARLVAGRAARTLAGRRLAARLHDELQRSALLCQTVESINAGRAFTHLLPTILASAASLVGARVGLITRRDDASSTVRIAAVHHLSPDLVGRVMPLDPGVAEQPLRPGEAVVHDAEQPLPRGHPLRALDDTPVWLTVALGCEGGSLGTFALAADPAHRFGPSDAQIAQLFAGLATLAIEKAQLLARAQEAAALQERQRIARDLHDSVTQTLFGLQTVAQAALDAWATRPEQARMAVETVQHLARAASVEMRTLLVELREGALQGEDLAGALEQHVAVVRHQSGLAVDLEVAPDVRLPARHAEVLYRIVQEALSNVVKHARAQWARIMVATRAGRVEVRVEDDGVGFPADGPSFDAFGLRGMHERVSALGGSVQMGNGGTGGAYVHAELPLSGTQDPIALVTAAPGM